MKKILGIVLFAGLLLPVSSQVFDTGNSLGTGNFSLGVNPAVHVGGPSDGLNLYLHAGYGLKSGIDLGVKFGFGRTSYFGADIDWAVARNISVTTGVHSFGDFGLDGTLNLTFPLRSDIYLFSGLDMDLVFGEELQLPLWIPVGVQIGLKSNLSFILEGDIGLTDVSYHIINGGVIIYF